MSNFIPPEILEQCKKQWVAMGIDPNQMLQHMNNSMAMMANAQTQAMEAMGAHAGAFSAMAQEQNDDGFGFVFDDAPQLKPDSDLADPTDLKAVACGANLAYLDNMYLNTLGSAKPLGQILAMLRNDWSINSRQELVDMIEWLAQGGHSERFHLLQERLRGISKAQFDATVAAVAAELDDEDNFEEVQEQAVNVVAGLKILASHQLVAGSKSPSILAWDLGRAINLCRWGFDAQYLDQTEALERIRELASKLYGHYGSWQELSVGYLLGFFFWSGDEEGLDELLEGHQVLTSHAESPWTRFAW